MQVLLKGYQGKHVTQLLTDYDAARDEASRRARSQALILAAPTGAGKTVMAAALIENILFGGQEAANGGVAAHPDTTILWFSDNPELNEQSRRRILQVSDHVTPDRLRPLANSFDQNLFDRGCVYFLNTQKLRAGGLLVEPGNRRSHTIWQTIAATEAERPGQLLLVIDEAHRGLSTRPAEAKERSTILSRLIDGDAEFSGIRMVLGITATPDRFERYIAGSSRTRRTVSIPPEEIREDGIIKDRLMLHGVDEDGEHAWTMFGESIDRLRRMETRWTDRTKDASPPIDVAPLLLVQVEDRTPLAVSATPLGQLVEELRERWPDLAPDQVVHCFGERQDVEAGGWTLSHMEPADVSDAKRVRVVLFKTALNTGWDCPRAEVLMSFRTAHDQTAIAQLVGRMVRTPLGMRIDGDDELNSAYLYLPYFDRDALLRIRDHLTNDDAPSMDIDIVGDVRDLVLRPSLRADGDDHEVFRALSGITFDSVEAARSKPDLQRLFSLTRMLDLDGLAQGVGGWTAAAGDALTAIMVDAIDADRGHVLLGATRQVRIVSLTLEDGRIVEHGERQADLSDADIERAYKVVAPVISAELASMWLRLRYDEDDPVRAKADFLQIASDAETRTTLEHKAAEIFDEMFEAHIDVIRNLPEERRAGYLGLRRAARRVQSVFMTPPASIRVPWLDDGTPLDDHMYVEPIDGTFLMDRTTEWELATIRAARQEKGFRAFLRNYPRKSWAVSYAYQQDGGFKPGYPDFLVVRADENGSMVVDVLEPHRGEDSLDKARGLAELAERHGSRYGRIQMLRYDGDRLRRLRLESAEVRAALKSTLEQGDFVALFE
jgi:type III restriction enzyme